MAKSLDYETALLENPDGRSVGGSGGSDQRTFGDFLQQQVECFAGDPHSPIGPVDPVPNVILAVHRKAGNGPDQLLADEYDTGGDFWIGQHLRPMRVEYFTGAWDCDRYTVRFRVELQFVDAGQIAGLNRTQPNTFVGGHSPTPLLATHPIVSCSVASVNQTVVPKPS